jgi:ubiquinone/menaquinone biosynthesis C-methylase UbiE
MVDLPTFRKHDRYKASSYRSYNFKMPSRYDTCIWVRFAPLMDRIVVQELGPHIGSLRILDVGCATGRLLERLAGAGATDLSGVDLAPQILEVAADKLSKTGVSVDLRTADVEDCLPWDDESFDVVTLTAVLHHFFRPRDALAEIWRVLRPGGRLLVMDPSFFTPVRQILNAAFRVVPHDGDYHFYSATQATGLLAACGFGARGVQRNWAGYLVDGLKPRLARLESRSAITGAAQPRAAPDRRGGSVSAGG